MIRLQNGKPKNHFQEKSGWDSLGSGIASPASLVSITTIPGIIARNEKLKKMPRTASEKFGGGWCRVGEGRKSEKMCHAHVE
jgi:hypothetical protein